ncbi:MAG TPA: helix-turn-helix domain-containing protein [Candidatus Omnitrophota bacterium]|nr:helix-turn-helix domain-containing protein [Candidatus Omnitrophota bacterium]
MDLADKIENSFIALQDGGIYRYIIEDTERLLIEKALQKTRGNQILAARILGLNRNTIRTKIKKLKIDLRKFKE